MSVLAGLTVKPTSPRSVKWEAPEEVIPDILAARANGYGWETIAKALTADGHPAGKAAVKAWFERRERAQRDGAH